jgi:hypothetical protein
MKCESCDIDDRFGKSSERLKRQTKDKWRNSVAIMEKRKMSNFHSVPPQRKKEIKGLGKDYGVGPQSQGRNIIVDLTVYIF